MNFVEKLKEREWQITLVTVIVFLCSLFGVAIEASEAEKLVTGVVSAVTIVTFIINRAMIKSAEAKAYASAPIIVTESEVAETDFLLS
jgi:hypothetical protein